MSDIVGFTEANRRTWDERAAVHRADRTGFYGVEEFRKGGDTLGPIESAEIGDVGGKRLLHLQCHFGLDTLSLARRDAIVTGVDFSQAAIDAARSLAAESGLAARFVQSDVYETRAALPERFDVVYVSWGAICWLHDIRRWAGIVAESLAPGGFLYLADNHPFALLLEQQDGRLCAHYPWRSAPHDPLVFDDATTYTGDDTALAHRTAYEWNHPLSDILCGLIDHGLRLDVLHEHERLPWRMFPMMVEAEDGLFRLPDGGPRFPLAFSLKASKPAG
ncbi:MAG: class I SAM-dependent methyltransferase [Dongiaceae bacterium]